MINGAFKKVFGQEMPRRVLYVGGRNHAVLDSAVGNLTLLGRQTRFGIIGFHCSFGVSCSFLLCPYPFVSWFKHHCAHNMISCDIYIPLYHQFAYYYILYTKNIFVYISSYPQYKSSLLLYIYTLYINLSLSLFVLFCFDLFIKCILRVIYPI